MAGQPVAGAAVAPLAGYTVSSVPVTAVPVDGSIAGLQQLAGVTLVQTGQVVYDVQGNPITTAIALPATQQ